ncbi:MAG: phosphoribosyltransferase family protein [Leptospira sp.]|nr:phosphoribosyltransferase family protein [Leptospira sp.]
MFLRILSFFYSQPCLVCSKIDTHSHRFGVCLPCIRKQRKVQKEKTMDNVCEICSQIMTAEAEKCEYCSSRFVFFSQVVSLRIRLSWERKLLQLCKFQNERILSTYFALDFAKKIHEFKNQPDIIFLLPSKDLKIGRDYHPADAILRRLCKKWNIKQMNGIKKVSQEKQSGKSYFERFQHAKKAFQLIKKDRTWNGLHILIIDDIFTTGASLNEVARMLLGAGAERVSCMVLLSNEGD